MSVNSENDLCNMALSHLGNFGTVSDIRQPSNDKEVTFALWYDISRQTFLKMTMPNFALKRRRVARVSEIPPFGDDLGYQYAYEYPSDCLKALGLGEVALKEDNHAVEGGLIWTVAEYDDGAPLRFIKDVTDVSKMSPEFKVGFSMFLAMNVAMEVTQDTVKARELLMMLPDRISLISGLNAQENRPIRISHSRYREARISGFASTPNKL